MSADRRPDFFIVGAPKCGTTALFHYLSEHPNVFVPSDKKEPHYFSTDLNDPYAVRSEDAYLKLFAGARDDHLAIGEGSVWYLYSNVAVPRILEFSPRARLLVMLRDPVELFVSLHNQLLAAYYENEGDPERAWALQRERAEGGAVPSYCPEPRLLQYSESCGIGRQLERLLAVAPGDQVHVVVFDDFVRDPRGVYRAVLGFLGLGDDGRREFPPINEAYRPRADRLGLFHQQVDRLLVTSPVLSRLLPVLAPLRPLSRAVRRWNVRKARKPPLSSAFRARLRESFAVDVELLESLLGRDFSPWRRIEERPALLSSRPPLP